MTVWRRAPVADCVTSSPMLAGRPPRGALRPANEVDGKKRILNVHGGPEIRRLLSHSSPQYNNKINMMFKVIRRHSALHFNSVNGCFKLQNTGILCEILHIYVTILSALKCQVAFNNI